MNTNLKKGCVILRKDENLEKTINLQEEYALDNPENILLSVEPIFLINEAPIAKHFANSFEKEIPIVVILSLDKFNSIEQRAAWQAMNIPDLPNVIVEWAGDHSNVPLIKEKWMNMLSRQMQIKKNKLMNEFLEKTQPVQSSLVSENNTVHPIQIILAKYGY